MQNIYYENEVIDIHTHELHYFKSIQSECANDKSFFITSDNKQIQLKAGFVGIISTPVREIVILPRFRQFDFSVILKLWLVVNTKRENINENHIRSYQSAKDSLYLNVVNQFIYEVKELCNKGLSADYQETEQSTFFLRGRLNIEKYLIQPIQTNFICKYDEFEYNSPRNVLIKHCIKKLLLSTSEPHLKRKLIQLLPYFQDVKEKQTYTSTDFDEIKRTSNRLNHHYEFVISLCELIVNNMSLGNLKGKIHWFAFLVNYDKLFEDFVRLVLQIKLSKEFRKLPVSKRNYSRYLFEEKNTEISKSYDPDIVYLYNDAKNNSEFIIDVKNKLSDTKSSKNPSWFNNNDIFQVITYAIMQDSKKCALVYPSFERIKPIKLDITNQRISDFTIYAIFVDLSHIRIGETMKILAEDVVSII